MDVVASLKEKAINDFEYFISRLEKGYKDDYSNILNIICYLEIYSELDYSIFLGEALLHNG